MKKINLGFVISFNKNSWLGGNVYLLNLINQIKRQSKSINPIIITNLDDIKKNFKEFKNIKILNSRLFQMNKWNRIISKLQILLFGKDFLIDRFLLKNNVNILSHFFITGRNSKIKSLFWIPDFQEIHNPRFINLRRRILRKFNLFFAIKNSNNIILSSNTVRDDLKKINFEAYKKAAVFRPFFETPNKINNLKILKKYNIKNNFFLLPNQYWKHKNHFLILNILKNLKLKKINNIQVISTGYFYDYRHPNFTNEIVDYIKKYDLEKNYKILGVIPYKDLMDLMYFSIAVINPSQSEGWSSTVEQAKSMGKMVLLSNLKVHKEQLPYRNFYFNPTNQEKLKDKMINLSRNFNFKVEKKRMKLAKKRMILIKKKFINEYVNYIHKLYNE